MEDTLKFVGAAALILLVLAIVVVVFGVYWLIASWLVDSVMGFTGFWAVASKVVLVLVFGSIVGALKGDKK